MLKRARWLLLLLLVSSSALASADRTIDANVITSPDKTKTWTLPATSGTLSLAATPVTAVQEVPSGAINGSNVTFTLSYTPAAGASVQIFLGGLVQIQGGGQDYTISGSTITMAAAPVLGQNLYSAYVSGAFTDVQEIPSGAVNGSNTAFTLAYAPTGATAVKLFVDGLALVYGQTNDYTVSGTAITMNAAPETGRLIYAVYTK
jgi:hypothetical protein